MTRPAPSPDDEPDHLAELLRELRAPEAGVPDSLPATAVPSGLRGATGRLNARGLDRDEMEGGRHRPGHVPLVSIPASLRGMDLAVRSRAVRGLLVVAIVVMVVLGGRWAWASRDASPTADGEVVTPKGADAGPSVGPSSSTAPSAGPAGAAQPSSAGDDAAVASGATSAAPDAGDVTQGAVALLLVHVAGQVGDPGVVELPAGSRVVDAVAAAGGFTPDADQAALNLARPLVDGEQVWVGRPGEAPPVHPSTGMPPPGPGLAGAPGSGQGGDAVGGALLDLNTAAQADLEELPGIGPVTAGQILAWRDAHGRFSRVDELLEVSGIGERTLERLEPLVTVGG